ncbi:hypothetical protein NE237_001056 [Protea cynaroides]|uniref:Uncharacterized protein n=1 Tax=Protea cynaroides TaxID=273540 RepID=A0A9Q0KSL3_9MAGN|nr:hypothetical protein NE237_001056 [Protea cynaroides]
MNAFLLKSSEAENSSEKNDLDKESLELVEEDGPVKDHVTTSRTDVTLGDGLAAKEAEVPIRAKKKGPVGSHPDLSADPTHLPRRAERGKSTLDMSPSALPDGLLHIPTDSRLVGDPILTTSGSGQIRKKSFSTQKSIFSDRGQTATLGTDSNPLEILHSPIQSEALCDPSSSQLSPSLSYPACAWVPHSPPSSAVELSNLMLAKLGSNLAPSPSDPLAIVDSVGSSICGSDVDIIDPWDGNPIAVFSLEYSPSYLEPLPLASPHLLICSDDDTRSISDDYSSSNEARLEAEWLVSNSGCQYQLCFEFHVEDPFGINLMIDWDGVSNPEEELCKL